MIGHKHAAVFPAEAKEHRVTRTETLPIDPPFDRGLRQAVENIRGQFDEAVRAVEFENAGLRGAIPCGEKHQNEEQTARLGGHSAKISTKKEAPMECFSCGAALGRSHKSQARLTQAASSSTKYFCRIGGGIPARPSFCG